MKKIYLIRHCEAEGQPPESKLTVNGLKQVLDLSEFFSEMKINRIISSPYKRAIDSIEPLAKQLKIEIELDRKLTERILSTKNLPDWLEKLRTTFDNMELKFEGGESSQAATERILEVAEEIFNGEKENTIVVTHGNLMSLLLKYYKNDFGFEDWKNLSNPDVFLLKYENNEVTFERVWK
ncbi:histidine phosphatase family protein [Bacillus sp. JJ1773]|uniref:histidine phosphatase family protein n=1 Tax=Bacillus sp. JJ1773 TaxID=3122965 RepID=UPI002FFF2686